MLKRITPFALSLLLTVTALTTPVQAQAPGPRQGNQITPNFKDTDITQVIEAVSEITGKTFIIDPRVRGVAVNIIAQKPLTADEFYEAFLSMLSMYNFVAMPAGPAIKIMPSDNGRYNAGNDLPERVSSSSDEMVTQVFNVTNVSAAALATSLRPLASTQAHFSAYPPTNSIIISDRASNVNRLMRIIRRIDQAGDSEMDIMRLEYATAADVVRNTNQLFQAQGAEGVQVRIVADDRTNSVIITGEKSQRLRVKTMIAMLDAPVESGGGTQVRYLQFADAEKVAAILKDQATATAQVAGASPGQPPAPGGGGAGSQLGRDVTILADAETNALIITAPPKIMSELMRVIDRLDIRRAQVLVEAIIVDVSLNKSAALGVNWAVFSEEDGTRIPAGGFINPVGGVDLIGLARAIDDPSTAPAGLATGSTFGIGRIATDGVSFAAMLRAVAGDENSNVVSFPKTVTLDNQEAELKVAREVPFVTGQFTNTGGNNNGSVNPFQTIQREEVGTILRITPQINEGGSAVRMKIELESSDVLPASAIQGAVDLTTSKRTINTNVLIEDRGIVVLGGLVQENYNRQESRVPFLGRIPLLGLAFKTRSGQNNRTNLMVFIRATILRDSTQTAIETNSKYNYIRDEQQKVGGRELLPLFPGAKKPLLPELSEEDKKAAERAPAPPPAPEAEPARVVPLPPDEPPAPQP